MLRAGTILHASDGDGEGEERRVDVVVCSEREEAGLAAAAVALWAICLSSAGIVVFFELYALPVAAAAYA